MNLENCFLCTRPVLELRSQFEKLDTYLLSEHDRAYKQGIFGWCHARCLSGSDWGTFWAERRIQHMTGVLGFVKCAANDAMTALRNPRTGEVIALRADGVTFAVKPAALTSGKQHPEGLMLPVSEEVNLELDDPELARAVRDALVKSKYFWLWRLVEALALTDRMLFPEAIQHGSLRFDKSLRREWVGNWVSAIAEYGQFVPQQVVDLVKEAEAR